MRASGSHSFKRPNNPVKYWPKMEPLSEDAAQVFDQKADEQLLEELSSLCYVHTHQIVASDTIVKISGLDHLLMDILLAMQDCGSLPPNLLAACSIKAVPVTRPAQDGLWRANNCAMGSGVASPSARDTRSVLEYSLAVPRGALPALVAALRRDADTDHPQCLTASGFEVDFRLRGLIQLLNDHGFSTSNSCQDNHGHLWVEFSDVASYTDLMEVCYRHDKAWTSRFLASEDRCKTSVTWSVDAYFDEARKCEGLEVTRARPGRLTNGHASIRVPLQYFQEFTVGIFNIMEAAGKPARAAVALLDPFVAPDPDSSERGCAEGAAVAGAVLGREEADAGTPSASDMGSRAADGRPPSEHRKAGSLNGWLPSS